jgi:hypothetical protein
VATEDKSRDPRDQRNRTGSILHTCVTRATEGVGGWVGGGGRRDTRQKGRILFGGPLGVESKLTIEVKG